MPVGRGDVEVIVSADGAMVMTKARLAVSEPASLTLAVKLKLPGVDGVPVIDPSVPRESPGGADPDQR